MLLRRPVIQARQSVLSDELQTCWAECNLFPSLPTELRRYESSLVMCLISEPVRWHWNTGQPASQKKIMTFLRVLGILTHKQKYWVENPSPPKMITTFKGFFHETHIYYNPNPNHIYWKLSFSPCSSQKKNPLLADVWKRFTNWKQNPHINCKKFELLKRKMWKFSIYRRTPVTQTLKGNKKEFGFAGNSSYWGKFQWNFDQGKGNLVRVSREFELSEFALSRFM